MKTYIAYFAFVAAIGCALATNMAHASPPSDVAGANDKTAAPIQTPGRKIPVSHNVPGIETPGYFHSVPSEKMKPSHKNASNVNPVAAAIGGPVSSTKAASCVTGTINPAKSTAAINGTDAKRKP